MGELVCDFVFKDRIAVQAIITPDFRIPAEVRTEVRLEVVMKPGDPVRFSSSEVAILSTVSVADENVFVEFHGRFGR